MFSQEDSFVAKRFLSAILVFAIGIVAAGLTLVDGRSPRAGGRGTPGWLGKKTDPVVFLGGNLSQESMITFTTALAASGRRGVFLIDSPRSRQYTQPFIREYRPRHIVPVGEFTETRSELERRQQAEMTEIQSWPANPPAGLWKDLFPRADKLVIAPSEPRRLLLQAACLAGTLRAPLLVARHRPQDAVDLKRCLDQWAIGEVLAVGAANALCRHARNIQIHHLKDEEAVIEARLARASRPVRALVIANPTDGKARHAASCASGMSLLAPWLALQKKALLLLTNEDGTNVESLVEGALNRHGLKHVEHVVLAGDLRALPMQRRANPLADGKDPYIEMEPLTPAGREPFSFSVGRLFHEDLNVVALMQARPRLWKQRVAPSHKALLVSNPGGGLPLLETLSRNTAQEFRNAGYHTSALFGSEASLAGIRKLLPEQTIFLWEGHHSTLVREYAIPRWTEPMQPSLVFLQSCLALTEDKAQPFLRKGAVGVIGSSSRTYSGSGGALALAYFDALLYERQSLGGSLRQAKNFLLAFSLLKEKRLGDKVKLGGVNLRTAWAFTLWGDPTLTLPSPARGAEALPRVRHQVRGNTIRIFLPEVRHEASASGQYEAQMWANARLGGLLRIVDDNSKEVVPLVFAEVPLANAPAGKVPRFTSRLAGKSWVCCWDARRSCAYLLAAPKSNGVDELRFRVSWD